MDLQFTEKNRLFSIYVILLLVVAVGMFCLGRCTSGRGSDDDDYGLDTLHVAIEYAPMSMYTYADTLGGFNYDILRIISQNYGLPMMFHPIVSRQEGINGLMNNTFDLLVADIPATLGNEEGLKYTEPVYLDRQVLVQRRDADGNIAIKSALELGDQTVWVVKDSPMVTRLQNLSEEIGDTI
ncbi:MAG: transporter substrate-binding domain-containing protein, partial [Paramuribaculum sp.]|nr:transporter substrate-binding domain-containing protein [Paramuribaculum sp.]